MCGALSDLEAIDLSVENSLPICLTRSTNPNAVATGLPELVPQYRSWIRIPIRIPFVL